ncbi:hypothetical protein HWV62_40575 [Athelia sp. TMB]|nr:hypothetical protein HWV62_2780 [Athelia sp. TMB]KAF7979837.1 hypothetical protein HWV62_40575 [Athelia sp. TMB]
MLPNISSHTPPGMLPSADASGPGFPAMHLYPEVKEGLMADLFAPLYAATLRRGQDVSPQALMLAGFLAFAVYSIVQFLRPFVALYFHLRSARAIGLPMKVIPFPPGLFSFFAFQILRRLNLLEPGTKLHKLLSMGRPDGYDLHKEMGDVFVTVSPAGLTVIIADPKVATHVNSKRAEFPKPPNTGAIINIYGRNVINADGDVWRFHRRVTGPVFSERINRDVWGEAMRQASFMMQSWRAAAADEKADAVPITSIGADSLRLGLNVITGAAYGCPLGWAESPPCAVATALSYRESLEQLTAYLMPVFLTPHWALRMARKDSEWGRAWEAFTAFGGYMRGMLDRERALVASGEAVEENLMTVLTRAEDEEDEKEGRTMLSTEVLGNAFIFLFAGHETTANTLHYALVLLAQRQDIQKILLNEIDSVYAQAAAEGRSELEYEIDFNRARWTFAIMSETLRIYTPTGMTNKWTASDQAISFEGRTYVIPEGTRISVNGTGIHSNPKVWGDDATEWQPARWIIEGGDGAAPLLTPTSSRPPSPEREKKPLSTPPSPTFSLSPTSTLSPLKAHQNGHASRPSFSRKPSSAVLEGTTSSHGLLKPAKGTWLPFSEGNRACSGKKFATVEFVAVLFTLLREHRLELGEGWDAARTAKVLAGRKAGALTLQPPESVPMRFIRR